MADEVDRFLSSYDSEIQAIARRTRVLVREMVPDAEEKLHLGWKNVGYSCAKSFCAIAPHNAWVNLQFHDGAGLEDAASLLTGTGNRMRHVKLRSDADVEQTALAELVRSAARLAR